MSDFQPPTIAPQNIAPQTIAPQDDGSGVAPAPVPEAAEPVPITEQEVGEYREQDRFLPVRSPPIHRERCPGLTLVLPVVVCRHSPSVRHTAGGNRSRTCRAS